MKGEIRVDRYMAGMLATSRAGHDAGQTYVIADVDEAYVYLADGRARTLGRPKKKKKKHVQVIGTEYDMAGATDESIRRLLKEWKKKGNCN